MNKIKDIFKSRYGNDGVIIQGDESQLELRVLAYLSQDPTLIEEYFNDIDIHLENARLWKKDPTLSKKTEEGNRIRTKAKAMSFQLTYGAGAPKMVKTLGISLNEAQAFIKSFYDKYYCIREWHTEIIDKVRDNQKGEYSFLQGHSGRIWWFKERETHLKYLNDKGVFKSINPAEIKDLPVQGTASDVMIIIRASLVRKLLPYIDQCCIINTVHDSIILDCHRNIAKMIITILKKTMEDINILNKVFKNPFNVPLKADISIGPSWGELREV